MDSACTLTALSNVDQGDPEAVQALLSTCIETLLDPALWWWAVGLTVLFAVVGALIGWRKGRWLAGLLWGAALGPIGWIVVALMAPRGPACADCGHVNAGSAERCGHCGADLRSAAARSERSRLRRDDWASRRRD